MQRAAASSSRSPSSTANTPTGDSTGPRSAKRQKLTDSEPSTPGTPAFARRQSTDLRVVSAALATEEKSRSEARIRSAAAGGETEWILNLPGMSVPINGALRVEDGSADRPKEDEEGTDEEVWRDRTIGRRSYGGFKRKKTQAGTTPLKEASEDDDEELSEADVSDLQAGFSQHSAKRPMLSDVDQERADEKRLQAMDRMNLKKQNHISGYAPKRAVDDHRVKVKKKPRQSFKS